MRELFVEPFELPFMAHALVVAVLLGILGGAVGVLVVLRRLSFAADTLSHTVFPGAAIGFVAAQEPGLVWGALIAAVVSAALFTLIAAGRNVTEDSSLAILLTGFFAVGVVVVSRRDSYTSDLTTLLFGQITSVDRRQIVETAAVLALALLTLVALRKELLLRAFDREGAAAMGYRVPVLDLVANLLVALVVVAAVRSVGTVLVIALLIVPAATARLLTDRLATMVVLSMVIGVVGGWLGLLVSYHASVDYGVRLASGPTVVLAMVACYVAALGAAAARSRVRA